ncbi:MAG: 30S ribosomal protein S13 [Candidatus Magasanikbacteria bacterium GW2011_GWA2_45_39]|uniref:Small ribosomal subunit protein uS13 n=2 Tax=Candidatus Magasanikiibacteriota TaxID=1752731 RepID=A0A0G1Q8T0_9BACT|nr:MAG: 30S ribosomal protein S13 [Candidatus Magasanikbacteria bacterium GW2011_GWA2_45_39]KKU14108.1 MAG: 30S ribosomal protein S13 [Candidatus Magasanikbacteria bacterium GW2011_GWC2_45_8]HBW73888.1 30S ribosomal protein S13 [Candidatus Magasanikbacteria bacterium]
MIRIAGINLPSNKRIEHAVPYLYGIGISESRKILSKLKIDLNTRVKDVAEADANKLREYIEKNYRVEGDLRREILSNIKRLKEIGSYRGVRHTRGLPTRGQRTKTNSRTVRGNKRRTMGSGKRAVEKK